MLTLKRNTRSSVDVGGSDVNQGMQSTQSASAVMQLYTNVILSSPDIKLPPEVDTDSKSQVVEDLPKHQQAARANANHYLNNINPLMVRSLSDIIGFRNLWAAEFNRLVQLAQNIDQGNNKQTFIEGIKNLVTKVKNCSSQTQPIIDALNGFLANIQTDARNFKADQDNVSLALNGEQGAIAQLKAQLEAINSAISKDTSMIAGGAAGEVVGVLMITVGAIAEFETGGVSTALIVGGLAVMGGSSAVIGIAGKDLAEKQAEYRQIAAQLAKDEQIFTLTTQAFTTISSLLTAVNTAITAVQSLQRGWNSLQGDFEQVIDALDQASPDLGSWLVSTLDAANKDWQDTYQLALHLQQNGTLPVKKDGSSRLAA